MSLTDKNITQIAQEVGHIYDSDSNSRRQKQTKHKQNKNNKKKKEWIRNNYQSNCKFLNIYIIKVQFYFLPKSASLPLKARNLLIMS